ncbi:TrkH family potassium uptake protein [Paracoccus aerodenitrificans]|uniref:TrkH family potassium uptake protein n=1 Tax=Paracoccus aerodenitrificans TaxID=3017781 RepID=UPI0022F0729A|nr:TrkH family potassium uptake protein [Paracoccus aerodenitrificans]WBU65392.1 TrkH family potassium uptake protein [Paracoccus aerodenitrificans]
MIDIRPVAHTIAKISVALGAMMVVPAVIDFAAGDPNWIRMTQSMLIVLVVSGLVMAATSSAKHSLTIEQSFLLTSGLWLVLPLIGALPLMIGAPGLNFTDAYFESMSGLTTTGTTVIPQLDNLPAGTNMWRALLQWAGGLGIVVVAMVFLPVMKVGGMQFFRSEGFDTLGKVLPRAGQIAAEMTWIYLGITVACTLLYIVTGMSAYDAMLHALTTCSTGGFSNYDASFGKFIGPAEWVATLFMVLASIPFVRMVQAIRGDVMPLWRDTQVRAYVRWMFYAIGVIVVYRLAYIGQTDDPWDVIRETSFNVMTIFSGTGFASTNVLEWGHLPFAVLFCVGLIGGCTGSTGCSVKIFRYQVLFQAVRAQIRRMQSPHRLYPLRLAGKRLDQDVVDSVMTFFTMFILTLGLLIVGLSLIGLHPKTALTAAWTAVANIGPVWGPEITSNGSIEQFPDAAKWLMSFGMYLGRLELISVLVLLLPRFWRT